MSTTERGTPNQPAASDTTMWAMHIAGPDDLFAAPDRAVADAACVVMNAQFKRHRQDDMMQASVVEWPHGYEAWKAGAEAFRLQTAAPEAVTPSELTEDQAAAIDKAFERMRKERDALKLRLFSALNSDKLLKEAVEECDHGQLSRYTLSCVIDAAHAHKVRADEAEEKLSARNAKLSDEQIDEILREIDSHAREYDFHEYGLPLASDHGTLLRMRHAIRSGLATASSADARDVALTAAARDVLAERARQISAESWTPEHDDEHRDNELSRAAACYAIGSVSVSGIDGMSIWPWHGIWWKPADERGNLIKAGALILAEIERLDRAAIAAAQAPRGSM